MGDKRQSVFELDDDIPSMLGLVARRLLLEAEAKSRTADHDMRQQHLQGAPAEPGPRRDEYRALADLTLTNASNGGQSARVTTDTYLPVDVNHASLSVTAGIDIGADATA